MIKIAIEGTSSKCILFLTFYYNSLLFKIIENLEPKIKKLKSCLEKFKTLSHVGDVRNTGMIGAVEMVRNKTTKEPYAFTERIGHRVFKSALKKGAILRPIGNIIYFMPPLIITEEEIETLTDIAFSAIKEVTEN